MNGWRGTNRSTSFVETKEFWQAHMPITLTCHFKDKLWLSHSAYYSYIQTNKRCKWFITMELTRLLTSDELNLWLLFSASCLSVGFPPVRQKSELVTCVCWYTLLQVLNTELSCPWIKQRENIGWIELFSSEWKLTYNMLLISKLWHYLCCLFCSLSFFLTEPRM